MRVGVRRVRLALSHSQIKSVVGRSFRNANRGLTVAGAGISLARWRSPSTGDFAFVAAWPPGDRTACRPSSPHRATRCRHVRIASTAALTPRSCRVWASRCAD